MFGTAKPSAGTLISATWRTSAFGTSIAGRCFAQTAVYVCQYIEMKTVVLWNQHTVQRCLGETIEFRHVRKHSVGLIFLQKHSPGEHVELFGPVRLSEAEVG